MSDITIIRYNPPKSLLDIKLNILSLLKYFTIWIIIIDILYLTQKIRNILGWKPRYHNEGLWNKKWRNPPDRLTEAF